MLSFGGNGFAGVLACWPFAPMSLGILLMRQQDGVCYFLLLTVEMTARAMPAMTSGMAGPANCMI